jgi:E3 ubiquitin-protein ligase RAD18
MDGTNSKIDHHSIQQHLNHLDKVLRCNVCRNHFSNATCLASCGHSFCSACVIGRMSCPECRFPILRERHSIVPNRALNDMVNNFKNLPTIDEQIMSTRWMVPVENEPSPFGINDDDIFQEYKMPEALQSSFQSLSCLFCGEFVSSAVCLRVCGHSFCSSCIRQVFQNNKTGVHRQKNQCLTCRAEVGQNVDKQLVVNRTIQQVVVIMKNIVRSMHGIYAQPVDFTKPRLSRSEEPPINSRFPSRNYDKMKPRDLRVLCGQYGLVSRGGWKELRDRIKLFATMWNAEMDSISPRTQSKLVEEINQRERAYSVQSVLDGSSNHGFHLRKLNAAVDHNNAAMNATLTSGNEKFDVAFNEGFKALIRQGKRQKDELRNSNDTNKDGHRDSVSSGLKKLDFGAMLDRQLESDTELNLMDHSKKQSTSCSKPESLGDDSCSKALKDAKPSSNTVSVEGDDCSVMVWTEEEWNSSFLSKNAGTINKENRSSSSPPLSDVIVPSPPARTAKFEDGSCPNVKNSSVCSTGKLSQSSTSTKIPSTPSTKRACPIYRVTSATNATASASKQRRFSWECVMCTYVNDGSVVGYCAICQHTRKPIK